jgi:hypothetical protein
MRSLAIAEARTAFLYSATPDSWLLAPGSSPPTNANPFIGREMMIRLEISKPARTPRAIYNEYGYP